MLRLAHRILSQQVCCGSNNPKLQELSAPLVHDAFCKLRTGVPVIIADNVAEYQNERRRTGADGDNLFVDYPPMPPAFDVCFVEYNLSEIHYTGTGQTQQLKENGGYTQEGFFLRAIKRGEPHFAKWFNIEPSAEWIMLATRFMTFGGRPFCTCLHDIMLNAAGQYLKNTGYALVQMTGEGDPGLSVLFMTLAFMQCKNVERLDAPEEAPTPKWCRRQRVPELRYQVLRIDPNRLVTKKSDERKTEGDRSGKALHICRGHFAHYVDNGENGGLFGKGIYGTFWVPSHARGSLEHGRVVSTYEVKAPNTIEEKTNGPSIQ